MRYFPQILDRKDTYIGVSKLFYKFLKILFLHEYKELYTNICFNVWNSILFNKKPETDVQVESWRLSRYFWSYQHRDKENKIVECERRWIIIIQLSVKCQSHRIEMLVMMTRNRRTFLVPPFPRWGKVSTIVFNLITDE